MNTRYSRIWSKENQQRQKWTTYNDKCPVQQEDTVILNVYVLNKQSYKISEAKLIKLKGEIDESTIIAGNFNPPLNN